MKSRPIRVGISTCPNDTFTFHGLLAQRVGRESEGLEIQFGDVQELNERFAAGELDVSKVSFYSALRHAHEAVVLPVGSALGFGVGPLLLSRSARPAGGERPLLLSPGEWTTAHLLYQLLCPEDWDVRHVIFSEIMPALEAGRADYGLCIHEGRFTWQQRGLERVFDLGSLWEEASGQPLPLGGLLARKTLGRERLLQLTRAIRASLDEAESHREEAWSSMHAQAQELEPEVVWSHVELYVNRWTHELGSTGRRALAELHARARARGLIEGPAPEVLDLGLYHLVPRALWSSPADYQPASLASEGFVHLSCADQLEGTLATHFASVEELFLVELERETQDAHLRFETARDGAAFPHLHRPLEEKDYRRWWSLSRNGSRFELPDLEHDAGCAGAPPSN